jgi:hypothetical protein
MGRPAATPCRLVSRASSLLTHSRTIDPENGEASGRDRTQPARGTESLLNREKSGRIGDLQDSWRSAVPRAERISPPTREFAAVSGL